jgi:hypothetical protein
MEAAPVQEVGADGLTKVGLETSLPPFGVAVYELAEVP